MFCTLLQLSLRFLSQQGQQKIKIKLSSFFSNCFPCWSLSSTRKEKVKTFSYQTAQKFSGIYYNAAKN